MKTKTTTTAAAAGCNKKVHRVTKPPKGRVPSLAQQNLEWKRFATSNGHPTTFCSLVRMDLDSFLKLLSFIRPQLGRNILFCPLIPEIRLYVTLSWLARGRFKSVLEEFGVTDVRFRQQLLWSTMEAIIESKAPELQIKFPKTEEECLAAARGFQSICYKQAIDTCVCAVDGYLLELDEQYDTETSEENADEFFSYYYHTYGMNIQGASDHQARFVFLGIGGPGDRNDDDAIVECPLGDLIESLPGNYCAIGDCGYIPTEHLVPLFGHCDTYVDENLDFNFYAAECRIQIENAFGMMLKNWTILKPPLACKPSDVWRIVECLARLHNFWIDERILKNLPTGSIDGHEHFHDGERIVRADVCERRFEDALSDESLQMSKNRDRLVARIASKGLKHMNEYEKCCYEVWKRQKLQRSEELWDDSSTDSACLSTE